MRSRYPAAVHMCRTEMLPLNLQRHLTVVYIYIVDLWLQESFCEYAFVLSRYLSPVSTTSKGFAFKLQLPYSSCAYDAHPTDSSSKRLIQGGEVIVRYEPIGFGLARLGVLQMSSLIEVIWFGMPSRMSCHKL